MMIILNKQNDNSKQTFLRCKKKKFFFNRKLIIWKKVWKSRNKEIGKIIINGKL